MSYFLDEVSTGQDSSASYQILSGFFAYARKLQTACLISICQPTKEVFELCDRYLDLFKDQFLPARVIYECSYSNMDIMLLEACGPIHRHVIDLVKFVMQCNVPRRIIVLVEGQIIYQGPREDVLPYFAQLGYLSFKLLMFQPSKAS